MVLHAQQKPAMMQSVAGSQFGELAGLAAMTTPTKPTAQAIHRPADFLLQHEDGEDHDHDGCGEIEGGEFRQPKIARGAVEQHPCGEHECCAKDDGAAIFAFEDGGVAVAICQYAGNQNDDGASHKEDLRNLVAFDKPFDERILKSKTGVAHGRQPDAEKRPCFQ